MTNRKPYVVVCTDFHGCFGIFENEQDAVMAAIELTRDDPDGCMYRPVEMAFVQKMPIDKLVRHTDKNTGQYL